MKRLCRQTAIWSILTAICVWAACQPTPSADTPLLASVPAPVTGQAITYYVRPDGGSDAGCTGQVDAPYPGSGSAQPCAWDHPYRALPPGGTPRIRGGDTLIVAAGSYRMGLGAPGAGACEAESAYDCHMPPLPSGPSADAPTRLLGAGWDAGCPNPPELWGAERAWTVLNLEGTDHAEVACFEITDHASCVEDHAHGWGGSEWTCERDDPPYGPWAADGLSARDSTDISLRHLNVHGLASAGIRAGRLADWTLEDVRLAGNGWIGWEGDLGEDSANRGTLHFRRWIVEWNGCVEGWPDEEPTACWAQPAGGYGDGVGTAETGGRWVIEDSVFRHNTSDGLDLLYVREPGASVEVRRTIARDNAGDQIKTAGPTLLENVLAVSHCGFFADQPFTYRRATDGQAAVDHCRAGGSAVALNLRRDNQATVVNATLAGQGDCLLIVECQEGSACAGTERVQVRNSIALGGPQFGEPGDTTCLAWSPLEPNPVQWDHVLLYEVKGMPDPCPVQSLCGIAPGLVDEQIERLNAQLQPGSPAIDAGTTEGAPGEDLRGRARDGRPDLGAYEWLTPRAWAYLPLLVRGM